MMPSIALPTGPYDWHPETFPQALFDKRVTALREQMAVRGITHVVVHGNGFDHIGLLWLTHFTPKLGPAYALVPANGPLRLLFAGGPGMKPSAQKLTWVEDVAAIRNVEADVKRWLDETGGGSPGTVGLIEGTTMLRGDWAAVQRAAGGAASDLTDLSSLWSRPTDDPVDRRKQLEHLRNLASETLRRRAVVGNDLRAAVLEMERIVYAAGAQDIRVRIGRRPNGPPTTLPDEPLPMPGPTNVIIFLRYLGSWTDLRFVLVQAP